MNKPPIGILPKFIHDEQRLHEIAAAIQRYASNRLEIPTEWIKEYNDLLRSLNFNDK